MGTKQPISPLSKTTNILKYVITAVVFFAAGSLITLAAVISSENENVSPQVLIDKAMRETIDAERQSLPSQGTIDASVQQTLSAAGMSLPSTPTRVPVENTYSEQVDHTLGSADAPIVIVEFSDFRCPYCGRFWQNTLDPLLDHYGDLVRFVYRDYPIFGGESIRAAHASYCAEDQGAYWEYHDKLFGSRMQSEPAALNDDDLTGFARELDLNMDEFSECLANSAIEAAIIQKYFEIDELLKGAGTPTFLINGRRVDGSLSLDAFIAIIDEELIQLGIAPPS